MPLEHIEQILRQRIGLHPESVGRTAISSAVGRRMATRGIGSVHEYLHHLSDCGDELSQLIETVVIPETWFFRDNSPFQLLKKFAMDCSAAHPGQPLRALSVPCSTGEEPYSIAIMFLEADVPAEHVQVDAVDISRRALDFALAGRYGAHSFRGEQDPGILERYFHRDGARLEIAENVRRLVRFIHGNLLDPLFQGDSAGYDVIFCRNLMIYFDDQTRSVAYRTLRGLLAPHGLLFVGHAECGTVPLDLFHNAGHAHGFAFRHGPAKPKCAPAAATVRGTTASRRRDAAPRSLQRQPDPVAAPAPHAPAEPLQLARQLADQGRFNEALHLCEGQLRHSDLQAEAYLLLGTIRMAEGQLDAAEQALRRSLYLNPKHYGCLVQMTLLLQQKGEHDASARMRRRAQRAAPQALNG